jgi:hypothetical protein
LGNRRLSRATVARAGATLASVRNRSKQVVFRPKPKRGGR